MSAERAALPSVDAETRRRWVNEKLGHAKQICRTCGTNLADIGKRCIGTLGDPIDNQKRPRTPCEGYRAIERAAYPPARLPGNVVPFPPKAPPPDALGPEIIDASSLTGYHPQPISWIVDGLIPAGSVCLFSGEKSLGKSYMLLDLLTAAALGQEWLGHTVARCKSFGMFCEDSDRTTGADVLGWRLMQILKRRGATFEDLENALHWRSGVGRVSYLWSAHRTTEQGKPEELWLKLEHKLDEYGSQILVLDTRSHVLNANPNSGFVATMFINWLTQWAAKRQAAVILTVQPPKDKSTQWAGANEWSTVPRAHLHLQRPKHFDPESGEGRRERVLKRIKGNLGDDDQAEIPIVWDSQASLFVVDGFATQHEAPASGSSFFGKTEFDMQVLGAVRSLILDGAQVYAASHLRWSLVKLVGNLPGFARCPPAALLAAQDRLLAHGHLERYAIGDRVLLRPKHG